MYVLVIAFPENADEFKREIEVQFGVKLFEEISGIYTGCNGRRWMRIY